MRRQSAQIIDRLVSVILESRQILFVIGLYLGLAVFSTWPLAVSITEKIPLGESGFLTVPFFNLWTIWWNSECALHGFARYWDAPIFFPTPGSFAFSEPQPMTLIVAPLIWIFESRAFSYNVYLLLSLILNGVFARRLLRVVGLSPFAAFFGGAAIIMLPVIHWQIDVIQLVPVWGILCFLTAVLKQRRNPTLRNGMELGLAYAVVCYCSIHHALFFSILLSVTIWVLIPSWTSWNFWQSIFVSLAIVFVTTGPLLIPLKNILSDHEFSRTESTVQNLSATPLCYLAMSGQSLLQFPWQESTSTWRLSPGFLKIFLAIAGIGFGLLRRNYRRWTLFLIAIGGLAFLLSLGANLDVGPIKPWQTLVAIVPGFEQVRSVFRFSYFVQIVTVLLAAQGLYALMVLKRIYFGREKFFRSSFALLVVFSGLAVFEIRPGRMLLARVEVPNAQREWTDFLRENAEPDRGVLCLPMAPGDLTQDFERTVIWMYWGTYHKVPLVNGYSGFFPDENYKIRNSLKAESTADVLRLLDDWEVEFVVISQERRDDFDFLFDSSSLIQMTLEFECNQVVIFRIESLVASR